MKNWKKPLIALAVVAAIVGAVLAVLLVLRSRKNPVPVYYFDQIGMSSYWGDQKESYGPVSTDGLQTVFLTDSQTVTEVLVKEGDSVKKGDVLMTYDTSLTDLSLERARLNIEKQKLAQKQAEERYHELDRMVPMEEYEDSGSDDAGNEDLGEQISDYRVYGSTQYDGSSREKALIAWINSSQTLSGGLLNEIFDTAQKYQQENFEAGYTPPSTPEEGSPEESTPQESSPDESNPDATTPEEIPDGEATQTSIPQVSVDRCYVVIKTTSGDRLYGSQQVWQGLKLDRNGSVGFFAPQIPDFMMQEGDSGEDSGDDGFSMGSGYTAAQLSKMKNEQLQAIKDAYRSFKEAEAEYDIMLREVGDGKIRAELDGTVLKVVTPEQAKEEHIPLLKVSGGGGFYIRGSISELERDALKLGQEVNIQDWDQGGMYTGKITKIGDFPTENNSYSSDQNLNVSYYPFTVFVDESANLQSGRYVSVQYTLGDEENGIYLMNAFVRQDEGGSYVLRDARGSIEKCYVRTGKSAYGYYTEIRSGITADDKLAFPYGKDAKEGAPTKEGDMSSLYGY